MNSSININKHNKIKYTEFYDKIFKFYNHKNNSF